MNTNEIHTQRFCVAALWLCLCVTRPAAADAGWDGFVESFLHTYYEFHPTAAISDGLHQYDGQIGDWTPEALKKRADWLHEARREALAYDANALTEAQQFEREYLVAAVDGRLFWLERADDPHRDPGFYIGPLDPNVYVSRPYAPLSDRMRAYVSYLEKVPAALAQARANLRTPLPRTFVHLGRLAFGGYATFYRDDVPAIFAAVDDAGLQQKFQEANKAAIAAMEEMDAWFEKQEAQATDDFALGAERFREMLWDTERVDVPLQKLKSIGEADLERNLAALKEACAAYAPGKSLHECMDGVEADKPRDGPVAAARRQLHTLHDFIVEHDIVSIPGTEEAKVDEAPAYRRWNAAYINIPGPYEKNLPSVYYIAPPDPSWTPEEQKAYIPGRASLLFTTVHEVWPGHFLQFLHANRAKSKFGQVFVGYAFAEGWAHYTEEMMWEAGLGQGDPEIHIGQLREALLRNVRYLSAIGLHTGGMTVEESERMFRQKAFQDPGNARQQAARGTFDPAYLNYTMGKLMIRKLRSDWTAARGGRQAWLEFHDRLLSFGGPPIPLVRKAMLGEKDDGVLF